MKMSASASIVTAAVAISDNKCKSNKSFCNKMGFNCPKDVDASFFFDFEGLGIECGKYDTSDCSEDDDEDLFITQVE